MTRTAITLLLVAGLLTTAAAAAHAARPTVPSSRLPGADDIESNAGPYKVWSAQIHGSYYLLERDHGHTHLTSAAGASVTLDPKLGPDAGGRTVVVYQHCSGSSCTIWRYDLKTHANRRLTWLGHPERATGTDDASDIQGQTLPTIWHGQIAFQTRVGGHPRIEVGSSTGPGALRTVKSGTGTDGAYGIALGPRDVLLAWEDYNCDIGEGCTYALLDDLQTGRQRTLAEGDSGEECEANVSNPYFNGHVFAWLVDHGGDSACHEELDSYTYNPSSGKTTKRKQS